MPIDDTASEFDDAAAALAGERSNVDLSRTIDKSFDIKPDAAARTQQLAQRAGMPAAMVEGREDEVERQQKLQAINVPGIQKNYPALKESLAAPGFAEISHDDIEALKKVEDIAPSILKGESNSFNELQGAAEQQAGFMALVGMAYGLGDPEQLADFYANRKKSANEIASRAPGRVQEYRRQRNEAAGFVGAAGAAISNPRAAARDLGAQIIPNMVLPSIMSTIAGAGAGAAGGAVGGPVGAAIGAAVGGATGVAVGGGVGEIGAWLDQELTNKGIDTSDKAAVIEAFNDPVFRDAAISRAQKKAIGTGGIDAAFNLFAGKYLHGLKAGATVGQKAAAAAKDFAIQTAGEGASEAGGQLYASGTVDTRDVFDEMVIGSGLSAVEVAQGARRAGSPELGGGEQAAEKPSSQPKASADIIKGVAEQVATSKESQIKEAHDVVRNSKTVARNPDAFRDFVAKAAPDEQVFIDGAAAVEFFQTLAPEQQEAITAAVPEIKTKLAESAAAGTDLPISKADYMAFVAPHKEAEALVPHLRFSEDDYTIEQLRNVDDLVAMAEEDIVGDGTLEPEEQLARRLETELTQAGMTPDAARIDATLARNAFTAFGDYTDSAKGQQYIQDAFGRLTIRAPQSQPRFTNVDRGYVKGLRDHLRAEARKTKVRNAAGKVTDMFGTRDAKKREKASPKPIVAWLASKGGIQRNSPVARELTAIGLTPEKYPGLYTSGEGLRDLDNIPASEFNAQFADVAQVAQEDGNGYVDRNYMLEALRDEDAGKGGITAEQRDKMERADQYGQVRDYLDQNKGIDVLTAPDEDIIAALRDFSEVTEPERELFQTAPQPTFFSALGRAVDQLKQNKADAKQWLGIITNAPGVKAEEIEWTGVKEWLEAQPGQVTKAELQVFLAQGGVQLQEITKSDGGAPISFEEWATDNVAGNPTDADRNRYERYIELGDPSGDSMQNGGTRYSKFQTPGGDNYREVLLTLPSGENNYRSSHFDEKNILAHIRMNERTDEDGNRVLFLEEVQSDWHQAGRKQGYKLSDEAARRAEEATGQVPFGGVPDAPFKKTWHELAMKRILRMAVDEGFDKVAWTTGEQQAERYDLSKQISKVEWRAAENSSTGQLKAYDNDERLVLSEVTPAANLGDFIGKDIAEKLLQAPAGEVAESGQSSRVLSGVDLKVGGDGMKGFYDKILPNFANKYVKKWGSKVSDTRLMRDEDSGSFVIDAEDIGAESSAEQEVIVRNRINFDGVHAPFNNLAEAEAWIEENEPRADTVHAVDITDAMRESVMQGQPLFQTRNGEHAGSIAYLPDGRTVINLFQNANLSTALHEMGHFYWGMLDKMNGDGLLNERGLKDWATIRNFVGADEGASLSIDQEEKIARAFEAYLREGKAPSLELQRAFQRFKAWLTRIYAELKALNITINDDVRAVFDRMLATDEAIEAMKDNRLFRPDQAVMEMLNEEQKAQYVRQAEKAIETSKERLLRKALRQAEKETSKPYKAERSKLQQEVTDRLNESAVYKALDAMQKGELADGTTFDVKPRLDRKKVRELMGQDTVNAMPRATLTGKGMDPEVAADMFGFSSARSMIDAMINVPDKKTRIEELTNQEMSERFGDMLNDGTIEREALDAFHNLDRAAQLEIELKFSADKAGIRAATSREFKLAAERTLGNIPVDSVLKSTRFYYAELKAAREFGRALAKKDYAKAADAKRRQLFNHHLLRTAEDAAKEVDSALKKFKKLDKPLNAKKPVKIDEDYHTKIRELLAAYSFGPRMSDRKRTKLEMETLAAWVLDKQVGDDAQFDIPDELLATDKSHYRDLSLDEFRALRDTVLMIEKGGRRKREYMLNGERRALVDVVAQAVDTMGKALPVRVIDRNPSGFTRFNRKYFAALVKSREYLRQLDGGDELGIFHDAVIKDIDAGMDRFVTRQEEAGHTFRGMLKQHYSQKELYAMVKDGQIYEGLGSQAITKENLMMMAANWGNEGNREALLKGEGWTVEAVENALATLDKRDWQFVQGVWDWFGTYWPEVAALERRRKGVTPKRVEASPFTARHTDGEMQLAGGYFPIAADPARSVRAQEQGHDAWAREAQSGLSGGMTRRNHTKARVGAGQEQRPLWLSFGVMPRHINMVLRDLELGEATHKAQRFLRQPDIKNGIVERLGMDAYSQIDLWAKDVAIGDLPTGDAFTAVVDRLRANASIAYMGFSLSTLVQQFTGLTNSAAAMGAGGAGWKWVGVGLKQLRRAYTEDGAMDMNGIYELSEFMANRSRTMTMDINDASRLFEGDIGNRIGLPAGYQKVFLAHIQKAQSIVDAVTWLGALEKARREGKADDLAAKYADDMVRSQASGLLQDLSGLERGSFSSVSRFNRWAKMFTFMYSYFGAKFNLVYGKHADYKAGRITFSQAAIDTISVIWVDAMLSGLVMGRLPDEDDDDDFAVRWLKWFAQQPANLFPMFREANSALQGFDGSAGGAFGGFISASANLATQVEQGEVDTSAVKAAVMFTGLAVGIPATQINRLINVAQRASQGEDVGYIDFVRSRKPSEK